jgi:hypothetical protein
LLVREVGPQQSKGTTIRIAGGWDLEQRAKKWPRRVALVFDGAKRQTRRALEISRKSR